MPELGEFMRFKHWSMRPRGRNTLKCGEVLWGRYAGDGTFDTVRFGAARRLVDTDECQFGDFGWRFDEGWAEIAKRALLGEE